MHGMDGLMERCMAYATYNEDGNLTGITGDAPDEARTAYEEFVSIQRLANDNRLKI